MTDQSLLSYIKQNIRDGFSEMEIRQALLGAGWGAVEVEEAFSGTRSKPRVQSMDILEKELEAEKPVNQKSSPRGRRTLSLVLILVIVLPVLAFAGFWVYQRFMNAPSGGEQVNSAVTSGAAYKAEAAARDQQRLQHIETLQTSLSAFYTAKQYYPQALEELKADYLNVGVSADPATGESYLYSAFGEVPIDYSLTFILETDFGTLKDGLHTVSPTNVISAAGIKTKDQVVKGIITRSPSQELVITDLSGTSISAKTDVTVALETVNPLEQAILVTDHLKLTDFREPFQFTFSAPAMPGEYEIKVFGFAKNGSILFQSTKLSITP